MTDSATEERVAHTPRQLPSAKYSAIPCAMGYAIVMLADGEAVTIETGIRSQSQAQKRVAYWTKAEAKANKQLATKEKAIK